MRRIAKLAPLVLLVGVLAAACWQREPELGQCLVHTNHNVERWQRTGKVQDVWMVMEKGKTKYRVWIRDNETGFFHGATHGDYDYPKYMVDGELLFSPYFERVPCDWRAHE